MGQVPKGTADDPLVRLERCEAQIELILQSLIDSGHPCPNLRHSIARMTPKAAAPAEPTAEDRQAAHDEYGVRSPEQATPAPPASDVAEGAAEGGEPVRCPQCLQPREFPQSGCADEFHPSPVPPSPEFD